MLHGRRAPTIAVFCPAGFLAWWDSGWHTSPKNWLINTLNWKCNHYEQTHGLGIQKKRYSTTKISFSDDIGLRWVKELRHSENILPCRGCLYRIIALVQPQPRHQTKPNQTKPNQTKPNQLNTDTGLHLLLCWAAKVDIAAKNRLRKLRETREERELTGPEFEQRLRSRWAAKQYPTSLSCCTPAVHLLHTYCTPTVHLFYCAVLYSTTLVYYCGTWSTVYCCTPPHQ